MLNKGGLYLQFCLFRASNVHFRKKKNEKNSPNQWSDLIVFRAPSSFRILIGQASSRKGHGIWREHGTSSLLFHLIVFHNDKCVHDPNEDVTNTGIVQHITKLSFNITENIYSGFLNHFVFGKKQTHCLTALNIITQNDNAPLAHAITTMFITDIYSFRKQRFDYPLSVFSSLIVV